MLFTLQRMLLKEYKRKRIPFCICACVKWNVWSYYCSIRQRNVINTYIGTYVLSYWSSIQKMIGRFATGGHKQKFVLLDWNIMMMQQNASSVQCIHIFIYQHFNGISFYSSILDVWHFFFSIVCLLFGNYRYKKLYKI